RTPLGGTDRRRAVPHGRGVRGRRRPSTTRHLSTPCRPTPQVDHGGAPRRESDRGEGLVHLYGWCPGIGDAPGEVGGEQGRVVGGRSRTDAKHLPAAPRGPEVRQRPSQPAARTTMSAWHI